jgi:hypothetical protein
MCTLSDGSVSPLLTASSPPHCLLSSSLPPPLLTALPRLPPKPLLQSVVAVTAVTLVAPRSRSSNQGHGLCGACDHALHLKPYAHNLVVQVGGLVGGGRGPIPRIIGLHEAGAQGQSRSVLPGSMGRKRVSNLQSYEKCLVHDWGT